MSVEVSPRPGSQPDASNLASTVLHPHKSYRRKYRKIMVKFEQRMREGGTLFKDHQRLFDISQRVAEQNDQLLSLLLELNSQPQIPGSLRYDLREAATTPELEKHEDEQKALEVLRTTRHKVQKAETYQSEYQDLEHRLLDTVEFAARRSYASLLTSARLERKPYDTADGNLVGGFLSHAQEDAYLQALDDFLDGKGTNPRAHATSNLGYRHAEKSVDRERETQLRNPLSVYNWLRKNQPQVFLQDPDNDKAKVAASRKSKRESAVKKEKAEEFYDEEGIALEPAGKGKRKRDEDGGYRPKGGNARPPKRRKGEDGSKKRASMDISAS